MVKPFKRVLMGAILFTGINVMAGGFDADSSNDILDNSDDASESCLDDAGHRIVRYHLFRDCVESYIQAAAKEKGIKKPVKLVSLDYSFMNPDAYTIALDKDNGEVVSHTVGIVMNPLIPASMLSMLHHELGHMLFREKYNQFKHRQIEERAKIKVRLPYGPSALIDCNYKYLLRRKEEIHQELFAEEQFADAAVPDNKAMLKAERSNSRFMHVMDYFVSKNIKIRKIDNNRSEVSSIDISQMSLTDKIKILLPFALNERRTFSKPMDETKARELENFKKIYLDDTHPSFYRRAYYFDDRIKALEAKERSVSIEKGAAFNDHVEQLTTSDLLS